MTNEERIEALAQSIYQARNGQKNDVTGVDLESFIDQTIEWVNQFTPEIEKKADWNFVRTNDDDSIGSIDDVSIISYDLPADIRKIVVSPYRDLTIRQDGAIVGTFKMVSPNQIGNPVDYDFRPRATQLGRSLIFSQPFTENELSGRIVADSIRFIPKLSRDDVSLLDIFDTLPDIRQLYVFGILKNQILPDIVQGGLTPSYSQKFDDYLADCIKENNESADAYDADYESFAWVQGVGF